MFKILLQKVTLMIFSLAILTTSPNLLTHAAATTDSTVKTSIAKQVSVKEQIFTLPSLKPTYITKRSVIKVKKIDLVPTDNQQIVVFTLSIYNGDNKEINLIDYWYKLKTRGGASFSVKQLSDNKHTVAPKSSDELTYYAYVSPNVKIQDLMLQVIKWDFSMPSYERKISEIIIPTSYTTITPINQKLVMSLSGNSFKTSVIKVTKSRGTEGDKVELVYLIENIGIRGITLPSYKYYLKTTNGLIYPLDIVSTITNSSTVAIQPKLKKELKLTGTISFGLNINNAQLVVALEDSKLKIELTKASYRIPNASIPSNKVIEAKLEQILNIQDTKVNSYVKKFSLLRDDETYNAKITFTFHNLGNKSVKLSKYSFSIKNSEGITYPLPVENVENTIINPRTTKDFEMNITLPRSINVNPLSLNLYEEKGSVDVKEIILTAAYKMTEANPAEPGIVGRSYDYKTKNGLYGIELKGVKRAAFDDQDILAAEIVLTNKSKTTLPILELSSLLYLDGVKINQDLRLIKPEGILSILEDKSATFLIMVKLPYTYQYSSLKLQLQEKMDQNITNTIMEFRHNADIIPMTQIAKKERFDFLTEGRKASISVKSSRAYYGTTSDILYTEVEMTNNEMRRVELSKLYGYFKTSSGIVYPAIIKELPQNQKINPTGKVLLEVYTILPKNISLVNFRLVMGEALTDGTLTTSGGTANAFMNAAEFDVNLDPKIDVNSNKEMDISPYRLAIRKVTNYFPDPNYKMSFYYDLEKNSSYEVTTAKHKLIIEVIDPSKATLNQTIEFEEGQNALTVGKDQYIEFTFPGNLGSGNINYGYYQLNIYDEFEGHKRLIGSRNEEWFISSAD